VDWTGLDWTCAHENSSDRLTSLVEGRQGAAPSISVAIFLQATWLPHIRRRPKVRPSSTEFNGWLPMQRQDQNRLSCTRIPLPGISQVDKLSHGQRLAAITHAARQPSEGAPLSHSLCDIDPVQGISVAARTAITSSKLGSCTHSHSLDEFFIHPRLHGHFARC
jgi:hypothetical protein